MPSVQWKSLAQESSPEQSNKHSRPVASIVAGETAPAKAHSDQQPPVTEALVAAFTWLFGSGCY